MSSARILSMEPITTTYIESFPDCDNLKNESRVWKNLSERMTNHSIIDMSCLGDAPSLTNRAFVKAVVLGVMASFSLFANSTTIWSILKTRRKHQGFSAIYTLILHLSVADLFVTIFCMAGEAVWIYTVAWIWGNIMCKGFKFLQMSSLYLSTFVLVLIGVDRFIAVCYPMKSLNTNGRCNQRIVVAWIIAFVLSIPQFVIFRVARGPFIEDFYQCVTYGFYTAEWQEQLYTTLSLVFMFILPLIILICTYVSTIITISRNEKTMKLVSSNGNSSGQTICDINRRRLMQRAKSKSLRISIVIIAAFIIWWTPYYTMMIIFMFLNPDQQLSEDLQNCIFFFGMSNSLVNPLIYGAFHLWPKKKNQAKCQYKNGLNLQQRSSNSHDLLDSDKEKSSLIRSQSRSIQMKRQATSTSETILVKFIDQPNNSIKSEKYTNKFFFTYAPQK